VTEALDAGVEVAARVVSDEMLEALVAFGRAPRLWTHLAAYRTAGVDLPLVYPLRRAPTPR